VAQIKHPPILKGKTKKHIFFVFLKFFIFALKCKNKSQKIRKIEKKSAKFDVFHFMTVYEYVTKSAFFVTLYMNICKNSIYGQKMKNSAFFVLILCPNMGIIRTTIYDFSALKKK
jgi:cytosine/uracil/thiamine/allantoin permease